MRMRKNISLLKSLLILLCFVLVQGVFADKVIMKNGKEIKGRILKEEPDSITIMTPTMSIILQSHYKNCKARHVHAAQRSYSPRKRML